MTSKRVIPVVVLIISITIGLSIMYFTPPQIEPPSNPSPKPGNGIVEYPVNETWLDSLVENIASGGPPPDGIPPIENPIYWNITQGDEYLEDHDIVFGFLYGDIAIAYPQRILVWHEIVNVNFGDEPLSITYCPLTGSCVAFKGTLGGNSTTFGTSGKLINSNLMMYDRASNSFWPQISHQAITGQYRGAKLETYPLVWTNWAKWKATYPNTLVLSTDTGFTRNYNWDPYGSYTDPLSYYYKGDPFFPLMNEDDRLHSKAVVVGLDYLGNHYAVEKHLFRTERVVNTVLAGESFVMIYDETLGTVRSFFSTLNNQTFTFRYEDGMIIDNQTDNHWSSNGSSNLGQLAPINNMDVMWFAWSAFFPDTGLLYES